MKDAIQFVRHAVINRTFDESVTEIHACGNHIQSNNGIVVMNHPSVNVGKYSVSSTKLIKAIEACNYEPKIKHTEHNLIVSKGNFRAQLPYNKEYTAVEPDVGKTYKFKKPLLPSLQLLFPFISEDASRVWSQSMMAKEGRLYTTNNIIVARVKTPLPDVVLPIQLISAMLKVKKEPESIIIGERSLTVFYNMYTWIQCKRIVEPWPAVEFIFKGYKAKRIPEVPKVFINAIETIKDFVDDDVLTVKKSTMLSTMSTIKDVGVRDCCISCVNTLKAVNTFTHIDFGMYPNPMYMKGPKIQGVLAGMFKDDI